MKKSDRQTLCLRKISLPNLGNNCKTCFSVSGLFMSGTLSCRKCRKISKQYPGINHVSASERKKENILFSPVQSIGEMRDFLWFEETEVI